jgi:hypothetical protein
MRSPTASSRFAKVVRQRRLPVHLCAVAGWRSARRQACRAWRGNPSRRASPLRPGHTPGRRPADGRSRPDARGSGGCGRSPARIRAAWHFAKRSRTGSGCAPPCRRSDHGHFRALDGWRPIGASTSAVAGDDAQRQRQVVALHRARLQLAHQVGLRGPGSWPPPAARWCPCPGDARCRRAGWRQARRVMQQGIEQRAGQLPLPGCTTSPAGLSMTMS